MKEIGEKRWEAFAVIMIENNPGFNRIVSKYFVKH